MEKHHKHWLQECSKSDWKINAACLLVIKVLKLISSRVSLSGITALSTATSVFKLFMLAMLSSPILTLNKTSSSLYEMHHTQTFPKHRTAVKQWHSAQPPGSCVQYQQNFSQTGDDQEYQTILPFSFLTYLHKTVNFSLPKCLPMTVSVKQCELYAMLVSEDSKRHHRYNHIHINMHTNAILVWSLTILHVIAVIWLSICCNCKLENVQIKNWDEAVRLIQVPKNCQDETRPETSKICPKAV